MSYSILIVDDEEHARTNIKNFLLPRGYEILEADTLASAKKIMLSGSADIILLDVLLPDGFGPTLLDEAVYLSPRPQVIVITAHGDIEMAVEAMRNGAHYFLAKPIQLSQLQKAIESAQEVVAMQREIAHYRMAQRPRMDIIMGNSPAMKRALETAERAAKMATSVLITGATGTGKEVIARYIHQCGPRANKPFIAINTPGIQPTMLESELFGYEKGAFTSAESKKLGQIEVADQGTLFLDEIASTPLEIQGKLLRVLESKTFYRVGGIHEIKVDVHILAASNRNLETLVEQEKFRNDLLYRLKVVEIRLPTLNERREDIPELAGLFIRQMNAEKGSNISGISPKALEALINHTYRGNIRELRNIIERAFLFCDEGTIDLGHLGPEFGGC